MNGTNDFEIKGILK